MWLIEISIVFEFVYEGFFFINYLINLDRWYNLVLSFDFFILGKLVGDI